MVPLQHHVAKLFLCYASLIHDSVYIFQQKINCVEVDKARFGLQQLMEVAFYL